MCGQKEAIRKRRMQWGGNAMGDYRAGLYGGRLSIALSSLALALLILFKNAFEKWIPILDM